MKLKDIQDVKKQAHQQLQSIGLEDPDLNAQLGALSTPLEASGVFAEADGSEGLRPLPRWFALAIGTTKQPENYRLAVRIRTSVRVPSLDARIRKALSSAVGGEELDVQFTGPILAIPPRSVGAAGNGKLKIGASISSAGMRGGTLGFFAKSRVNGEKGIVSANHVIGRQDLAAVGEDIVHPSEGSPGSAPIAQFVRSVPLGGGGQKVVDAAFGRLLDPDSDRIDTTTLPGGRTLNGIAALGESSDVRKLGFRSSETRGRVTSFDQDRFAVINYRLDLGIVNFDDQIEIESATEGVGFSAPGDSGSLVYTDDGRAVGLLFAHTLQGGAFNQGFSYANRIDVVLDQLQVDLIA
jgi:hypothetical protein